MMKRSAYLVLGYGVPGDILVDRNYQAYLHSVFNRIYRDLLKGGLRAVVVCSGGPTDIRKPFRRTEAGEMLRAFRDIAKKVPAEVRSRLSFVPESRSFSTLENMLFSAPKVRGAVQLTIFCEYTRGRRVRSLARRIFSSFRSVRVVPVDFDASPSRYLDPSFLREKERRGLAFDLWALQSRENGRKHHQVFREKVRKFRQAGTKYQQEAIRTWWEKLVNLSLEE